MTAAFHFLFIINPAAGKRNSASLPDRIRTAIEVPGSPHTCEIVSTEKSGHASELAQVFAKRHGEQAIVVACGGDGTAHEVANGLRGTPAALTILPLGTGNDFARVVLSSQSIDTLLTRLTQPAIRPIDLIQINDRTCLNITSFGFDTRVQRLMMSINRKFRWLGQMSYPLAIVIGLLGQRRFTMKYFLKGSGCPEKQVDYILAALCNGRFYGGGFNPAPQAEVDDGQIELVLVDPLPLRRIVALIPLYKKGQHLNDPAVHLLPVTSGHLAAPAGFKLLGNIDGELFEAAQIDFEILPQAVRFAFY
ncbi:MAG: diacylglycerol kinase catalytic region [Firmicutes bacterium]|nr:diacylglycerol kinase catalytic region [Bacillota bacterium]